MWPFNNKPKRTESEGPEVVLRQGWNEVQKKFWIQITDRRDGRTIRKWMDEEYYQNFHNMGRFTFRQTVYENELPQDSVEGEFVDIDEEKEEWKNVP